MDEKDLENTGDNITIFALLVLLEYARQQNIADWQEFATDIIYNNRFFPKEDKIVAEIKNQAESATIFYDKDKILYRARIYENDPYAKFMEFYRKELGLSEEDWKKKKDESFNKFFLEAQLSAIDIMDDAFFIEHPESIPMKRALKRWKSSKFKGYSDKDSLPPSKNASAGRANPDHISYTYLSEDETTPVYEVRPTIGQLISVAKFKLTKKLKIYDLAVDLQTINNFQQLLSLFPIISEKYSLPYNGNPTEYIPTQYITELIKSLGFDGVRFNSSLNSEGKNVVLFGRDYTVMSSKLVQLKKYHLDIEEHSICSLIGQNK
ncbi:MAG: RES family NAD+ phosphorylase [Candidatus Coproplasma sp.]